MNRLSGKSIVLMGALLMAIILPAAAGGAGEFAADARLVEITPAIAGFFEERGVSPVYLGQSKEQVPAIEWQTMLEVINAEDDPDVVTDDHDLLNSLVLHALFSATDEIGDPVYMTIGSTSWRHELIEEED